MGAEEPLRSGPGDLGLVERHPVWERIVCYSHGVVQTVLGGERHVVEANRDVVCTLRRDVRSMAFAVCPRAVRIRD